MEFSGAMRLFPIIGDPVTHVESPAATSCSTRRRWGCRRATRRLSTPSASRRQCSWET